jgi:hypothetical protein
MQTSLCESFHLLHLIGLDGGDACPQQRSNLGRRVRHSLLESFRHRSCTSWHQRCTFDHQCRRSHFSVVHFKSGTSCWNTNLIRSGDQKPSAKDIPQNYQVRVCHPPDTRCSTGIYESFKWRVNSLLLVPRSHSLWNVDQLERYIIQPHPATSSFEETRDFASGTAME